MSIPIPNRQLFIDGNWKAPALGKRIPIINPSTQQIIGSFSRSSSLSTASLDFIFNSISFTHTFLVSAGDIPAATKEDVDLAVAAAKAALSRNKGADWASASGAVRARYLRAIAAKVLTSLASIFSLLLIRFLISILPRRSPRKNLSSQNSKPSIAENRWMKPRGTL